MFEGKGKSEPYGTTIAGYWSLTPEHRDWSTKLRTAASGCPMPPPLIGEFLLIEFKPHRIPIAATVGKTKPAASVCQLPTISYLLMN
jgi:hypothetical protein